MDNRLFKVLARVVALCAILAIGLGILFSPSGETYAKKKNNGMPKSSWTEVPNTQALFGTPIKMGGKMGPFNYASKKKQILPSHQHVWVGSGNGGLPLRLEDTGGNRYPGFCGHAGASMSTNMTAKGMVTDPRIYALFEVGAYGNPAAATDAQYAAIQMVLWVALDKNWPIDMFPKYINHTADFGHTATANAMKNIALNWGKVINPESTEVDLLTVQNKDVKGRCAVDPADQTVLYAFKITTVDGKPAGDIRERMTGSVGGMAAEVKLGLDATDLARFGLGAPEEDVMYVYQRTGGQKEGSASGRIYIDYKEQSAVLQKFKMLVYVGQSYNQPFMMPINETVKITYNAVWSCECPPGSTDPECVTAVVTDTPEGDIYDIPVRWYNMPLAFGEFKAGNPGTDTPNAQVTSSGTYAESRSDEKYEAMLGVPTTERFYVNLGGTEGYIDVEANYRYHKQEFLLSWSTPWSYTYSCGTAEYPSTCTNSGTGSFSKMFEHTFETMTITSASFRPIGDGHLSQNDLDINIDITNNMPDPGTFVFGPLEEGLTVGPGTGFDTFSYGATESWQTSYNTSTSAVSGRVASESDGLQEAISSGNAGLGQLFAQSDYLTVTVGGKSYEFTPNTGIITVEPFGNNTDLDTLGGKKQEFFKPLDEKWDVYGKIPLIGYNGNPETDAARVAQNKKPLMLDGIPINEQALNGVYEFESSEAGNYINYDDVTVIKGSPSDIQNTVWNLLDGKSNSAAGTARELLYPSAKEPTDPEKFNMGNKLYTQYTNWQAPVKEADKEKFNHSGVEPDGILTSQIDEEPRFRSINPIILHNPVTTLHFWVDDVVESDLSDQRIQTEPEHILTHPSKVDGRTRNYIDYNVTVSIPNLAAYDQYWDQSSKHDKSEGIIDSVYAGPGVLGKLYDKDAGAQASSRQAGNPHSSDAFDVSKWIDQKYIKFPYKVYFYGGGEGADAPGFYQAGTWIKLYDDDKMVKLGDMTDFTFKVSSDQKDIEGADIEVVAVSLNAPYTGGEESASAAEGYVNGTRNDKGMGLGDYATEREQEATYSAYSRHGIDLIGRIGNFIITDSTDPRFEDRFWNTLADGRPDINDPVNKEYGPVVNMFDYNTLNSPASDFPPYDRYSVMSEWRGDSQPSDYLPLKFNTGKEGYETHAMKTGYNIGGSLQTLGDYDYEMWIYPEHGLEGNLKTIASGGTFKLLTEDPVSNRIREYYDSSVNHDPTDTSTLLGTNYVPSYEHVIADTLANPRMKLSEREKATPTYAAAINKGMGSKIEIGTPTMMVITQPLRTWAGSDNTSGRVSASGYTNMTGSDDCPCSFENLQKWNFNFSLPDRTRLWGGKTNDQGVAIFEPESKNILITTHFHTRTKVDRRSENTEVSPTMPALGGGDYMGGSGAIIPTWDLSDNNSTPVGTGTPETPPGNTPDPDTPEEGGGGDDTPSTIPPYIKIPPTKPPHTYQQHVPKYTDSDTVGTH